MYDIVGKRKLWFAISALLTLPGLLFIFLGGLRPSIDFTGGTEWEVRYAEQPTAGEVEAYLVDAGYADPLVTALDDGFLRIRTEPIDLIPPETAAPSVAPSPSADRQCLSRRAERRAVRVG
jgi:preprotein translocase subunit SecF